MPKNFCEADVTHTNAHPITSLALTSSDCGMVTPYFLAVRRLTASPTFIGCSTAISAALEGDPDGGFQIKEIITERPIRRYQDLWSDFPHHRNFGPTDTSFANS
jgi:hypothetical protein